MLLLAVFEDETFDSRFSTIFELGEYFFTVLLVLIIHLFFTYGGILLIFGKINIFKFFSKMKNSLCYLHFLPFSSSAATIPINLKTVEENLGGKSVASFTVPLGATINMDGTAIMQGVATVFSSKHLWCRSYYV